MGATVNGPWHYAEAERLIGEAGGHVIGVIATAQVHATLALAAATATNLSLNDYAAWVHLAARVSEGDMTPYSPSRDSP